MKKVLRKRYIRNTIMIAMVIVLAACSCFTYGYAKEQAQSNAIDSIKSQFGEMPSGQPPQFDNSQSNNGQSSDGEQTTDQPQAPPEMQNGDTQNGDGESAPPDMQNGNGENTPPDMNGSTGENADGSQSANGPSKSQNGPSKSNSDRPQRPNDNGAGTADEGQQSDGTGDEDTTKSANGPSENGNQQMPNNDGNNQQMTPPDFNGDMSNMGGSATAQIDTAYVVILGAENLLLAAVIVYLILSGFNKRGFKATLKNTKNAIIFTLSVLIIAGGITFAQFAISGKTEIPFDSRPQFSQSERPEFPSENESTTQEQATDNAGTNEA